VRTLDEASIETNEELDIGNRALLELILVLDSEVRLKLIVSLSVVLTGVMLTPELVNSSELIDTSDVVDTEDSERSGDLERLVEAKELVDPKELVKTKELVEAKELLEAEGSVDADGLNMTMAKILPSEFLPLCALNRTRELHEEVFSSREVAMHSAC
jgi:hypothetical protein